MRESTAEFFSPVPVRQFLRLPTLITDVFCYQSEHRAKKKALINGLVENGSGWEIPKITCIGEDFRLEAIVEHASTLCVLELRNYDTKGDDGSDYENMKWCGHRGLRQIRDSCIELAVDLNQDNDIRSTIDQSCCSITYSDLMILQQSSLIFNIFEFQAIRQLTLFLENRLNNGDNLIDGHRDTLTVDHIASSCLYTYPLGLSDLAPTVYL